MATNDRSDEVLANLLESAVGIFRRMAQEGNSAVRVREPKRQGLRLRAHDSAHIGNGRYVDTFALLKVRVDDARTVVAAFGFERTNYGESAYPVYADRLVAYFHDGTHSHGRIFAETGIVGADEVWVRHVAAAMLADIEFILRSSRAPKAL